MALIDANVARAQDALARAGIGAVLSYRPEDCAYLSGRRAFVYRVIAEGRAAEAVYLEADRLPVLLCMADYVGFYQSVGINARPMADLLSVLGDARQRGLRVAVAPDTPHGEYVRAAAALGPSLVEDVDPLLASRTVKGADEIDALRSTAAIAEAGMAAVLGSCRAGLTEAQAAAAGEAVMRAVGAESFSFSSIVTSGPEAGLMREVTTDRPLADGDWVLVDLGCSRNGYNVEFARSRQVGPMTDRFRAAYAAALEAQTAAIESVAPGIRAGDLDATARQSLERSAFAELSYHHITGHGIGTGVWEQPVIGPGSEYRLEPGNVFTIEPSIVSPGEGTIRIEDLVVVTDSGFELLTRFPVLVDDDRLGRPTDPLATVAR